ncbi:MAG: DNA cytosine methyltransferase, partial [Rhodocyclaceae bacterium]|nr:DNA cytosine methyltransferase [Rhodocyclaceae bacterium]
DDSGAMYTPTKTDQHAVLAFSAKDHGADAQLDLSPTLRAGGHSGSHANAGVMPAVAFESRFARNDRGAPSEVVPPLKAQSGETGKGDAAPLVLAPAIGWSEELTAHENIGATLQRGGQGGRHDGVMTPAMQVRRLTPVECERLQGFPDGWTDVPYRGKPAADGPRYKALGNSMAVNVMRFIGERIQAVEAISQEQEQAA